MARSITAFSILGCVVAFGAPTAQLTQLTQTQAILAIRGATGACTLALSTSPSYSPTHPDVDATEWASSNVDTSRADTITQSDGTRVVTLGHQTDDRALAALTTYYWQISGCGGTASGSFTTPNVSIGTSTAWPVPFNSAKWGNRAWPFKGPSDLLTKQTYVDPLTGVQLSTWSNALDMTMRYPGGGSSPVTAGTIAFTQWAGGSGWSNPGNILNGSTSTASTTNTNSIDIYPDQDPNFEPWRGTWALNDLGVKIFAGGTDASSTNRAMTVCIIMHASDGCVGTPITVTAAQGSIAAVASSSTDPDHPFPNSFPAAFFSGWGTGVFLPQESRMGYGTLACTSGTCTVDSVGTNSHWSETQKAGDKVYIAGSSPTCTNNLCTIASVTHAATAVISENLTIATGTAYRWFGWGIRVAKTNSTGTLTIGAAYKIAGAMLTGQPGASQTICSPQTFQSGDTPAKTMRLCAVPSGLNSRYYMYAVATDGTVRQLWTGKIPASTYFTSTLGWSANDVPYGAFSNINWGSFFPGTDARSWYMYMPNATGVSNSNLYKLHYDGDTTESRDWAYGMAPDNSGYVQHAPSDNWTWSLSMDSTHTLVSQIASLYPSYNSTLYGTSFQVFPLSSSGTTAYFTNAYSGQDGGGGWIAVVDIATGVLKNLIHTMSGDGTNGIMRFGLLHSLVASPPVTAANGSSVAVIGANLAYVNDTGRIHGGPFMTPIYAISRSGSWDTNTCMDWPPNGGSGACSAPQETYDDQCPAGNPYVFMGANTTGHQCIKVEIALGGTCNIAPNSAEKSTWPCPAGSASISGWTAANYAQPFPMQVGDNFIVDCGSQGCGDNEHFRLVQIVTANDGSGHAVVWLQRNSMWDYCSIADSTNHPGGTPQGGTFQFQHTSPTVKFLVAAPAYLNGCVTGLYVLSGQTQSGLNVYEVGRSLQGHGDLVTGDAGSNIAYVGNTASTPQSTLASLFAIPPPPAQYSITPPTFNGTTVQLATFVQAYASGLGGVPWIADSNTLNGPHGEGGQEGIGLVGSRTLTSTAYSNVYDITVLGTASNSNYKLFPMLGYAGRYNLADKSGAASDIRSSAYAMCYAYNAGECIPGSTAGHVYVNVPFAYNPASTCAVAQNFASIPCVLMAEPGAGGFRQLGWDRPDPQGARTRSLGYCFGLYGTAYAFELHQPFSTTQSICPPQMTLGWGPVSWMMGLPPWVEDSANRTQTGGIAVKIPSGLQYAEVQFGYSRYVGPNQSPVGNFFCTPRSESCNTSGSPFNFESETRTLTTCTSGCTITIPAIAPNLVYYRVRRSSNGTTWVSGDTQAVALP